MLYKAEFNSVGNNLYWHFHKYIDTDRGAEYFNTVWCGYNDSNWWNNVAPYEAIRTIKGDEGTEKVFIINFKTCEVKEV